LTIRWIATVAAGLPGTLEMKTFLIGVKAVVYMTVFLSVFGWLALSVRSFDRVLKVSMPAGAGIFGIVLMAAGGILGLACAGTFIVRGQGTPAPFDAPKKFVAIGPYRYVRNPMYIGGILLLGGFGLYQQSVSILLLAVALSGVVHVLVILYEEPTLKREFGEAYEEYCRVTHRWVPAPTPRAGRSTGAP
jgi:protein-S-isoprenylcysteine O-methyltransferase Ste14